MEYEHAINDLLSGYIIHAGLGNIQSLAMVCVNVDGIVTVRVCGDLPKQKEGLTFAITTLLVNISIGQNHCCLPEKQPTQKVTAGCQIMRYLKAEWVRNKIGELAAIGLVSLSSNNAANIALVGDIERLRSELLEGTTHLLYEVENIASCYRHVLDSHNHHFKPLEPA